MEQRSCTREAGFVATRGHDGVRYADGTLAPAMTFMDGKMNSIVRGS